MSRFKILGIFFISIFFVVETIAQEKKKNCKEMILKQIRKMADHNRPKKGHYFQFSIHSNTMYKASSNKDNSELKMEIIIGQDKSFYNTDYFSIYSDRINQFVILHPQQIIQWDQALTDELKQTKDFHEMINYEDSLISSSELCDCQNIKTKEGKFKKGVFRPSKDFREMSGLEEMEVWVNLKNHEIYKVINLFSDISKVEKQEVIYKHMDYNYKGKVPKNAHDVVFSEPGILSLRFKNYELIDQRKEGFYEEGEDF